MKELVCSRPTVSKLGLIIKEKPDGSQKRRIVVDALRSGANRQAACPERVVLPRPDDVFRSLQDLKAGERELPELYLARGWPRTGWRGLRLCGLGRCVYKFSSSSK